MKTNALALKLLSALMAIAVVLGMFAVMPQVTSAVSDNATIDLSENWLGNADRTTFWATWEYTQSTHTLYVYDNVTVIGTVAGAAKTLNIRIDSGKKVAWKANYSGNTNSYMIRATSKGTLEISTGGSVKNNGSGAAVGSTVDDANITVSGGTVSSGGAAIYY